ncbi:uncharacterized protein TNCV_1042381 [Trichonephila clavipes]|nr:uncharacterized protein TNCV_1042381 [Trichonephila clavipes]
MDFCHYWEERENLAHSKQSRIDARFSMETIQQEIVSVVSEMSKSTMTHEVNDSSCHMLRDAIEKDKISRP